LFPFTTVELRIKITQERAAAESMETEKVPVMSMRKPNMTGIIRGPMFPIEEMRPTTLPTEVERWACSAGGERD